MKKSPWRNTTFCPTRWTVREESLEAVLNNYMGLMELWACSLDICKDTEMKTRIRGVQGMMATFPFYFGYTLGAFILKHTDNLSHAMQCSTMSAPKDSK